MVSPIGLSCNRDHKVMQSHEFLLPRLYSPRTTKFFNLYNNFISGSPVSCGVLSNHRFSVSISQKKITNTPMSPNNWKGDKPDSTLNYKPQRVKFADYKEIEMLSIPNFVPAKKSLQPFSIIRAFATNSTAGVVRNYNEDRVSIMINIPKDPNKIISYWPSCSIFAVYDGHGGSDCADYLRDNLHNDIIANDYFPINPLLALKDSIAKIEKQFCQMSVEGKYDHSGSCAIIALLVGIH